MALTILIAFSLGLLTWTFTEYAMHNWVGHKAKGKNAFSKEHLKHHRLGNYFTPWAGKALRTVVVLSTIFALTLFIFGTFSAGAFTVGFALGYAWYEYLHWSLHVNPPRHSYGRWARRHHFHHHFENPKMNHGVTTPLWDVVFGTYEAPATIRVPKKIVMPWLIDPVSRTVYGDYVADFKLR
jgi:4-hydroxysphinganine ceramide fatty acyl 2-hydroxylase